MKIFETVDFALLAKQKNTLVKVRGWLETKNDQQDLDGLIHFLDAFQDAAVDKAGKTEAEVFPTIVKYGRKCSITGKGMNDGWCINEGQMYVKEEADMLRHLQETEYKTLQEAYDDEYCYWTEWEGGEDDTYFDEDGNEFNKDETPVLPEPVISRSEIMDTEIWKTRFNFQDVYDNMNDLQKEVISHMTNDQFKKFVDDNCSSMSKGFEGGIMTDWSIVASTVSDNLTFPQIKYKHQREFVNGEWEDTEHDDDGNVVVYDTQAEADLSLQEYINDVNEAHAKGDMDEPYYHDCKVVPFIETI